MESAPHTVFQREPDPSPQIRLEADISDLRRMISIAAAIVSRMVDIQRHAELSPSWLEFEDVAAKLDVLVRLMADHASATETSFERLMEHASA